MGLKSDRFVARKCRTVGLLLFCSGILSTLVFAKLLGPHPANSQPIALLWQEVQSTTLPRNRCHVWALHHSAERLCEPDFYSGYVKETSHIALLQKECCSK